MHKICIDRRHAYNMQTPAHLLFESPELASTFIDATEENQRAYKTEYDEFVALIDEEDSDFTTEAIDLDTRIDLVKDEAAATNPLPHHKLRELDFIIEEISQKITLLQGRISSHYDKIIHTTRRMVVPATDEELFKAVTAFLQVEKTVKKPKVYKVLTAIMRTAEEFRTKRSRETEQPQQQAPAQITSTVKYKAAELTCNILKFPPTPFKLIEWKDNMWR